jgi:putative aldouronate transport system substrate-binding protein
MRACVRLGRSPEGGGAATVAEKDMQEFNDLRRTIHAFVGESIDRFIMGDKSLDKDWDSYVAQLNQIGRPRFLEILEASQAAKK